MTYAELHLAVRAMVQPKGFSTFVIDVQVVEQHPGRVEVKWSVFVPRDHPLPAFYFKALEPKRLLDYLETMLAELPSVVPPEIAAIGTPPTGTEP